jgi:hypothetical protein
MPHLLASARAMKLSNVSTKKMAKRSHQVLSFSKTISIERKLIKVDERLLMMYACS